MAVQSLAVKYRPQTFDDVTEQGSVKTILMQQLQTKTTKNAYLFCGGAGTGKTTCARIFANELNGGVGTPIEMDAASNNSVDDVRNISQQARTQTISGGDYKVFIIDECHSLSNTAWQAFLKILEEPPAMSVFIFCTTDPQKIPKTILSRVQRYDFQRISHDGIVKRLDYIMFEEFGEEDNSKDMDAMEYIAKIADGGMRDAITLMDKCLAYSTDLTLENVVKALGTTDYESMFRITDSILDRKPKQMIEEIESIHLSGKDLKQFIKGYMNFILDICKYDVTQSFEFLQLPSLYSDILDKYGDYEYEVCHRLLNVLIKLNADIKWETTPKPMIESTLFMECLGE